MKRSIRTQTNGEREDHFVFSLDDKRAMKELEWENNNEFRLNGEMYDVIEKKILDHKLFMRCLADKKEAALLKKMSDAQKESNKNNKIVHELFQLLQSLFHNSKTEELAFSALGGNYFCSISEPLAFQTKKILTPPPQCNSNFISF